MPPGMRVRHACKPMAALVSHANTISSANGARRASSRSRRSRPTSSSPISASMYSACRALIEGAAPKFGRNLSTKPAQLPPSLRQRQGRQRQGRRRLMRAFPIVFAALIAFTAPAWAADSFQCSQIPHAQAFLSKLKPGPNTAAAQHHLDAAKKAHTDKQCVAELKKVDYYARRSAAADQKAKRTPAAQHTRRVACADPLHQDRPGGTDYKGPPVSACKRTL